MQDKFYFLDFETFLIEDGSYPKPVCLSWINNFDNNQGVVGNKDGKLQKKTIDLLIQCAEGKFDIVFQNGFNFDILVMWYHFPEARKLIIDILDRGGFRDTIIREKLLDLSIEGRIKSKGYSLMNLSRKYVGVDLSTYKKGDDIWRLRYAELDNIDSCDYPQEAIEYCLLDVEMLKKVFLSQEKIRTSSGPGSMNTESLQIKAAFALNLATTRGLKVDLHKLDTLEKKLDDGLEPLYKLLIEKGFAKLTKKGEIRKENKKFVEYLTENYVDYLSFTKPTKTHPKGQVKIDSNSLLEFPPDEIIQARIELSLIEKYKNTYCKNIRKANGIFRASYDILKETGRTSSFIQTMPREGDIREIFRARPGYKILTIDYAALEACSVAQVLSDLKLGSTLKEYLNKGEEPVDFHCLLGHMWYSHLTNTEPDLEQFIRSLKDGDPVAKKARTDSKPGGLSLAGGVGPSTMRKIAQASGVHISEEEARLFKSFALNEIPELEKFLGDNGWMGKQKLSGNPDHAYAYESNGRYRNMCTYCSCANGKAMQSLSADGAKEAIWECFKVIQDMELNYNTKVRFLAFIHDELIFEIPDGHPEDMESIAKVLSTTMCHGMKKVLPDVRITTEWSLMKYWTKQEDKHLLTGSIWVN